MNTQTPSEATVMSETGGEQTTASGVSLLTGEEVVVDTHPAWSAWGFHLIGAALVLLVGLASEPAFGIVVAAVIVAYVWYRRSKVRYVVTDRRIVVQTGLSAKQTNETWMEDVRGMQTGASVIERLLGHGHITVSHAVLPTGIGRFKGLTLGGIANYEDVARTIRARQSERKAAGR